RLSLSRRSVGASTALGAAAAGLVSAVLCAGALRRQSRPARRGGVCHCSRGRVVWRRSRARARSRLASEPSIARGLYPAGHPLASALDRRLSRSRLRLARKRNAAARVARSHLTRAQQTPLIPRIVR